VPDVNVPAAQLEHTVAPVPVVKEPAAQLEQMFDAVAPVVVE
jgi:hypothetical protein